MAQPIPDVLKHVVALNVEFQVLICVPCKLAVRPATISQHMARTHATAISIRKTLDEYVQGFPFNYDYTDIPLPDDQSIPQPIIPVSEGFLCRSCSYKTQSRRHMKKHGNKEHNKQRTADEDLFQKVQIQSWFGENRARYWIVDSSRRRQHEEAEQQYQIPSENVATTEKNADNDTTNPVPNADAINKKIKQWKIDAQERRLEMLKTAPVVERDSWLQYTNWNEALSQSKHNLLDTFHYTYKPDADEPQLAQVLVAWQRILERCLDTLEGMDNKDVLKWWASPKNEAASQRPFGLPQNRKTIDKYSDIFQRLICYVMRTAPMEQDGETETGVKFSEKQWKCIRQIRVHLSTMKPNKENQNKESDEEEEEENDKKDDLNNILMCLCMLMIMEDTSRITLYESPIMHYLAVRGIDHATQTFRDSFHYTPILAGMLWIHRLIVLEVAVPLKAWPGLRLKSRDEQTEIRKRIDKLRRRHLCEGSFSPTASILTQLAMGKSFNKTHHSAPNINWDPDGQTIYYQGKPVVLKKIQKMWQALTQELRASMLSLTFGSPVPTIDLKSIVDSMAGTQGYRQQNYSFINHADNRKQCGGDHEYLWERAQRKEGEWKLVKVNKTSNSMEWVKPQVRTYLGKERRFLRLLMVAFHIMGGQPARGPELGSVKVSNSIYSMRNIYVMHGRVCFLTMYDKTRGRRGNTDYIMRCLPDAMGQIVAQYLVRVRPFARVLDGRESEYLFGDDGGPWDGEELSQALGSATDKHLGVRLTVSAWRHVAIGIATRRLMQASKTWEKDGEGSDDEVEGFASGDDEKELELDTFRHIMVRQSGHGRRTAQAHYAIDGAFLHRLGPELITAFEQASIAWHDLFEFQIKDQSSKTATAIAKHKRYASKQLSGERLKRERIIEQVAKSSGEESDWMILPDNISIGLQRIYDDVEAKPRSEGQASALRLVHSQSTQPWIIVLPTDSGKSVLFFTVAAMCEQQTVIVVVPFASLVADVLVRGERSGLDCEEWRDEKCGQEMRDLVVVSADMAVGTGFLGYAQGLHLRGRLAHMFFDECHVALTDTSYRSRLRMLWQLRYVNCPFTALTATLMISMEGLLKDRLCIRDAGIFRRHTSRPGIRYAVQDSGKEAPSAVAMGYIQGLELGDGERGVIYVRSYATGEEISSKLECGFYRAYAEGKGLELERWVAGGGRWIVATGALGTGINIPRIIHIVHIGRPYGLTSFVQQSGRGGRDGDSSESMIITRTANSEGIRWKEIRSQNSVEDVDEQGMTEFIQSTICRRRVLGRYMDGVELDCRELSGVFCDICEQRVREETEEQKKDKRNDERNDAEAGDGGFEATGAEMVGQQLQQKAIQQSELIWAMSELQKGCIYCGLMTGLSDDDDDEHEYEECAEAVRDGCGISVYNEWRSMIRFRQSLHCWICGLSQKICRRLEEDERECEYPEIMLPGIFILHQKEKLEAIAEEVGFQGNYNTDIGKWLEQTEEEFGINWESNWMLIWRRICKNWKIMINLTK